MGLEQAVDLRPLQGAPLVHPQQAAVDPEDRRQPRDQQQVARLLLDDLGEQPVEIAPLRHLALRGKPELQRAHRLDLLLRVGLEDEGGIAGFLIGVGLVQGADELVELGITEVFAHGDNHTDERAIPSPAPSAALRFYPPYWTWM